MSVSIPSPDRGEEACRPPRTPRVTPARRLERLPDQFFAALAADAARLAHAGADVINLGQGNPDQPTPDRIVDALKQAAHNPAWHRYISFKGLTALKEEVARWYARRYQVRLDPEREIAILIGSKIGLQELSLAVLNPGDTAMVPDPGYPDYWSGIRLAGADMHRLPLAESTGFLPDLDRWAPHARLLFLNYPNNPTGRLAPPALFDEVIALAHRDGTLIAHDLAYGDIVYDNRSAVSLLARPGGREVGVEFTTLSKSYNMAGWRIGFAAGNAEIIRYLELLQDHLHCSQFGAIQQAAVAALAGPDRDVRQLVGTYQERRDRLVGRLVAGGWPVDAPEGSIFVWAKVPAGDTSHGWAQRFLHHAHVVVAPGTGFGAGGEGFVRISLTESADRLQQAADRLIAVVEGRPVSS